MSRLTRLRGREQVETWGILAREGQYARLAADLIKHHYDPSYAKLRKSQPAPVARVFAAELDQDGIDRLAVSVARAVETLAIDQRATTE